MQDYWHKQTADKPLFPDLLWSRPENKTFAGKLLIVGGNEFGFVAPATAYKAAEQAGIGTARMLLPDSLRPYVGKAFEAGELAPTTPSGSFSQKALADFMDMAAWADAVLLAGDFGRNSETAVLLEKSLGKYGGQITLVDDTLDYFVAAPMTLLQRPNSLLVLTFPQAQKLFISAHVAQALTSNMDRTRLVETLHHFSSDHPARLMLAHQGQAYVAVDGQVSSTTLAVEDPHALTEKAAAAAVWWLQNTGRPFEAITASLLPHAA